jgi:4-hydroxy-4-methyl-2-oxoglutarate aldolase
LDWSVLQTIGEAKMHNGKQVRELQRLGNMPTGLVEYSAATLSDGLQKCGLHNHVLEPAIRPLLPFTKLVGSAVTVKLKASAEPRSYSKFVGEAFEMGKDVVSPVLVLEYPQNLLGAAVIGSGGAHVMRNQYGFMGCVADGIVRDSEDLRRMNFQVFCRSVHPEYIFGLLEGVSIGEPVTVGGVLIRSGDIIVGDNDGVVAIPESELASVLKAANEILRQEREILEEIDGGKPYLEVLRRLQPEAFQGETSKPGS